MARESHSDRMRNENILNDSRANIVVVNIILIYFFNRVSYLNQFTQIFSKSLTGLKGHPRVISVIVTYRRGFVLVRLKVCGTSGL